MKGIRVLLSVLMVLLLFVGAAYGEATPVPAQVRSAAASGLDLFKTKVGPQASLYGFTNSDEVNRVTLGEGFQVHYVDAGKLRNASPKSLLAVVTPEKVWEFTVNLDGHPKAFLTIGFEDGEYRVVHFGGNAADFGTGLENFRRFTSAKGAGVQPTLVKAGPAYYLAGNIGAEEFVLPAVSSAKAHMAGEMDYSTLRPATEVLQYLQKTQRDSVPGQRGGSGLVVQDRPVNSSRNTVLATALGLCLIGVAGAVFVRRRRLHHG